jgi:hypothetical protein
MNEYWWDRSGTPDPEIRNLERLLEPLRLRSIVSRTYWVGFLQAGLAMAAALTLFWVAAPREPAPAVGWSIRVLAGTPRVGSGSVASGGTLSVGQWLTTDDSSAAEFDMSEIGHLRVEPGSRLCLLASDTLGHRIRLEEGMIHAAVWGPPRSFVVETRAGEAVDQGCEYTLTMDGHGHGSLCVEWGWVSLERSGRTALVPSGAQCEMRSGIGPGTPYLAGASTEYLDLLRSFDFGTGGSAPVEELIENASACDAFSLVYLVQRVDQEHRGRIFDRVAKLYPPWNGITRAGIVALETSMVATWQDQFECFESDVCRASCLPEVL